MKHRYCALLTLSAALASSATYAAPYSFQSIAFPGDTFTQLLGINNAGTIVGYHGANTSPANPNKGFEITQPGTFTDMNFPNSAQTQVVGINSKGDTAGFYVDVSGATHGFLNNAGIFANIDAPNTAFNQLLGLNDLGQSAGYASADPTGATKQQAFVRQADGGFAFIRKLLPPGVGNTQATDINNNGLVSGFYLKDASTSLGFLIDSKTGSVITLDVPGSTFTQALGLNDAGIVDGFYNDANGLAHGFLYRAGNFQTIDVPGALQTTINGINDKGQIVGFFLDAQENTVGFVGTPAKVPEPGSLFLLAGGLLGLSRMTRKESRISLSS